MQIVKFEKQDLQRLRDEITWTLANDITRVRVAIDTDGFKIKLNEQVWTSGFGELGA